MFISLWNLHALLGVQTPVECKNETIKSYYCCSKIIHFSMHLLVVSLQCSTWIITYATGANLIVSIHCALVFVGKEAPMMKLFRNDHHTVDKTFYDRILYWAVVCMCVSRGGWEVAVVGGRGAVTEAWWYIVYKCTIDECVSSGWLKPILLIQCKDVFVKHISSEMEGI